VVHQQGWPESPPSRASAQSFDWPQITQRRGSGEPFDRCSEGDSGGLESASRGFIRLTDPRLAGGVFRRRPDSDPDDDRKEPDETQSEDPDDIPEAGHEFVFDLFDPQPLLESPQPDNQECRSDRYRSTHDRDEAGNSRNRTTDIRFAERDEKGESIHQGEGDERVAVGNDSIRYGPTLHTDPFA